MHVVDSRGQVAFMLAAVKHRDLVPLGAEQSNHVWSDKASPTDDQNAHGLEMAPKQKDTTEITPFIVKKAAFSRLRSSAATSECSYASSNPTTTWPITATGPRLKTAISTASSASISRWNARDTCRARAIPQYRGIECSPVVRSNSKSWHAYNTSNPPTQNVTAAVSSRMRGSSEPRTAIHAAAGAMPSANPSTRCDQRVNRLVYE